MKRKIASITLALMTAIALGLATPSTTWAGDNACKCKDCSKCCGDSCKCGSGTSCKGETCKGCC